MSRIFFRMSSEVISGLLFVIAGTSFVVLAVGSLVACGISRDPKPDAWVMLLFAVWNWFAMWIAYRNCRNALSFANQPSIASLRSYGLFTTLAIMSCPWFWAMAFVRP